MLDAVALIAWLAWHILGLLLGVVIASIVVIVIAAAWLAPYYILVRIIQFVMRLLCRSTHVAE